MSDAEPHPGTLQVGGDARQRPSGKTCPVKIPAWVPIRDPQTDAFGFFRSARRKGSSAACLYRWLETGSQAVTEGRPQSTPVDAKAREYARQCVPGRECERSRAPAAGAAGRW